MSCLFRNLLLCIACAVTFNACSPSYPKNDLEQSVRKLFKKELGSDVETKLEGKTLYVAFEVENLVSKSFELPKDVIKKIEDAMLSISRISLSTDAEIDFTVIQARDLTWGVETTIIRSMPDLRGLIYWGVSKGDFDERLVLETKKIVESKTENERWHDITLPEYMGRWVASRISMGTRANPFLGVLLGIEGMTSNYSGSAKTLTLNLENSSNEHLASTSTTTLQLLRDSIAEQMFQVEKKYLATDKKRKEEQDWVREVLVEDSKKNLIFKIPRSEWTHLKKEN